MLRRTNKRPRSLLTKAGVIAYTLTRSSRRRTVMIQIDRTAQVKVCAPFYARLDDIHRFIHSKSEWIEKKVREAQKEHEKFSRRQYHEGEEFFFMGRKFKLAFVPPRGTRVGIEFNGSRWNVSEPEAFDWTARRLEIKERLMEWYRLQAKEILGGRIFHFARHMNLHPKEVVIRTQKRLWGSCHFQKGSIHLNWQLIMAPPETIDYVVVHELSHLKVPDHSARFWREVANVLPDYKSRAQWLKQNSAEMVLP